MDHTGLLFRSKADVSNETSSRLTKTRKKDIERELLNALFSSPDRDEEKQVTHPIRPVQHSQHGRAVAIPLKDTVIEDFTFITKQPVNDKGNLHFSLATICSFPYI